MLKEIHEQPRAVADTLRGAHRRRARCSRRPSAPTPTTSVGRIDAGAHRRLRHELSRRPRRHVTCIEQLCRHALPRRDRERVPLPRPGGAARTRCSWPISQSGETADTLAALRARAQGADPVARSRSATCRSRSLVRESELVLLTRAGPEIGVASTKAFTTQLAALGLLALATRRAPRRSPRTRERRCVQRLLELPQHDRATLALDGAVRALARTFDAEASRAVPRPRRAVPDRDGRRAQAQGDLLHPRRGLRRRAR